MSHRTLSLSPVPAPPPPDSRPLEASTPHRTPRGKSLGPALWRHNLANPWVGSTCGAEVRVQLIPGKGEDRPPTVTVDCLLPQDKCKQLGRGARRGRAPAMRPGPGGPNAPARTPRTPAGPTARKVSSLGHWAAASRGPGPEPAGVSGPRSHREWLSSQNLQIQSPRRRATQCGCSTGRRVPRAGRLGTANRRAGRGRDRRRGGHSGPPTAGETLRPLSQRGPPAAAGGGTKDLPWASKGARPPRCDRGLRP